MTNDTPPHTDPPPADALVIGAGATGLTAAWALARAGRRVTLLERETTVGGNLRTVSDGGWQVEQGPNTVIMKPPLYALLSELGLLDQAEKADPRSAQRFVVLDGKPLALPSRLTRAITHPVIGLRGWAGILREPFVSRTRDPEASLADFVRRRLGKRVLERLVDPFVSGVYAGDPARLSAAAAMPRLFEMEQTHGSLIRAQIARLWTPGQSATPVPKAWRGQLLSFPEGLQRLADRLRDAILAHPTASIVCQSEISRIDKSDGNLWQVTDTTGRVWRARQLILTLPAHISARLLHGIDTDLSTPLSEIVYPPVSVIALGYRQADIGHRLDGFGMLLPRREGRKTLGVLFPSSLFPGRAPHGHHLLNVFLGGRQWPAVSALSDAEQIAQAIGDLEDLLDIRAAPVWQRVTRWPQAIPQYEQGHLARLARLDAALAEHPGLFLAGNWRDGIAVGDCLQNGQRLGERVAHA